LTVVGADETEEELMSERPTTSEGVGNIAMSPSAGIVTKVSPWSVSDTLTRLLAIIDARGMKTFAVIDHSEEAAKVGLTLRETKVVIFGNAQAGTPVMEAAPLSALDLPLKILLYDEGNETHVNYTSPDALAFRYGIPDELARQIDGIDALTAVLVER
jgi:uncharacterized protein (DUF302 family)